MTRTRTPDGDHRQAFGRYLRPVLGEPALTASAEVEAAALVADGRSAENELAALGAADCADLARIAELRARIRLGDEARGELIAAGRRLVVALARRHRCVDDHADLLLEAGEEALSRAVDRYDPTGGLPFSSFARWWIERAMREIDTPADEAPTTPRPADPVLLTALGHLHEEDCRIVELRLGLQGDEPLDPSATAARLGLDPDEAGEREEQALAKLRHPCTPGNLTHLRRL